MRVTAGHADGPQKSSQQPARARRAPSCGGGFGAARRWHCPPPPRSGSWAWKVPERVGLGRGLRPFSGTHPDSTISLGSCPSRLLLPQAPPLPGNRGFRSRRPRACPGCWPVLPGPPWVWGPCQATLAVIPFPLLSPSSPPRMWVPPAPRRRVCVAFALEIVFLQ